MVAECRDDWRRSAHGGRMAPHKGSGQCPISMPMRRLVLPGSTITLLSREVRHADDVLVVARSEGFCARQPAEGPPPTRYWPSRGPELRGRAVICELARQREQRPWAPEIRDSGSREYSAVGDRGPGPPLWSGSAVERDAAPAGGWGYP